MTQHYCTNEVHDTPCELPCTGCQAMCFDSETAYWQACGWACRECGDLEMLEATDEETIVNGPFVDGLCAHCREDGHGAHDYNTKTVLATAINGTHVLVGECGGLSAVFSAEPSAAMPGCTAISTEHGYLYVDSDRELEVLNEQ